MRLSLKSMCSPDQRPFGRLFWGSSIKQNMKNFTLTICLLVFSASVLAQNLVISSLNPVGLYVCGTSQMTVTLQNGTGAPAATNLKTTVTFPAGIRYLPGTVLGATESNISNLNAPVFALADLTGGGTVSFSLNVTADCAVVQAINSGQTFSNTLVATYSGGSKQAISNLYLVETGLLNISVVSPPTVNAQKGDVILRTITMKNTRQGPIQSLVFKDQHFPGIQIELQGGINQTNAPTQFDAEIPGSYFSSFGNGNDLLEFDEEITLIEKVTVEDCGIPTFDNKSLIIIGWGCGGPPVCRADSVSANITIVPTTLNPNLSFVPVYAAPLSQCGSIPSTQEILIINTGELPATNVVLNPYTLDTTFHALDQGSFEWNNGSGWQSLLSPPHTLTVLNSCGMSDYSEEVTVTLPEVLPGDTVRLRFNTYYCAPVCGGLIPRMRVGYNYYRACPPNAPVGGVFNFYPDTAFLKIEASVDFEHEICLQEDSAYALTYWIKSGRLLADTGLLQVIFEIPLGLSWSQDCPFSLDGQTPLSSEFVLNQDSSTRVRMVFDLPFSQDSVASELCLEYHCSPNMPCEMPVPEVPPVGSDYIVYPPPSDCGGCQLKTQVYSLISPTPDAPINCAITICDEFILVVNDYCNPNNEGPPKGPCMGSPGPNGEPFAFEAHFDAYRINVGLQDNNDDRAADNNAPAKAPGVRLDRYLVGDTMRNEVKVNVLSGILESLNFRLFFESMTSDFGLNDGDEYDVSSSKLEFVNFDTTQFVSARIIIKTISGEQYTCPVGIPGIRSDKHLYQVAEPNIHPPQIVDILASMFDQYDLPLEGFISNGCLPQNFVAGAGDTVLFQADYKFTNNFSPIGSNAPPLINFRTSICDLDKGYAWKLDDFCSEKPLSQFSGYVETIHPTVQRIEPCAPSTETSPFQYNMRIARANMFPFEVRPLSSVTKYGFSLPSSVALLDTRLNFLRLQENVQLFGTTPLNPGFSGDSLTLDLAPFFANPLDEGYGFEIRTRFDTTCGYDGTKFGRTVLGMKYVNQCFHDPVEPTYYFINPNGYQSGSPKLEFNTQNNVLYLPSEDVRIDFFLRNNASVSALNAWMTIEADGELADVQLLLMPGQTPVPQVAGVYQLGDLASFALPALRLVARNLSCRPVKVNFHFGWDCAPVFNVNEDACGSFTKTIELRPLVPELELVVLNQPSTVPMCEPSGYFEFEVSNANDGTAFNLLPSIKLPPGMIIQPGSTQLSYPAGVAFINMPDPAQLSGNIWQFDPEAASNLLAQNGLASAEMSPLNKLRIRFRVISECGVVANSQPIYGVESLRACGAVSNVLRKPGLPIGLEGVEPSYTAVSNLNFTSLPGASDCGQEVQLSASIVVNDPPMAGDSIYLLLPVGTSYINLSYVAGANAPPGPPKVSGQQLQLPLPTNLAAGTVLSFTFKIRYDDPAGCADKFVILQTREKTQAFCASSNQFCNIYVATGEALLNINAQNPELQFNDFELNTQGTQTTFTAVLENTGATTATKPVVYLYHDQNGNGQIDPGEPVVATVNSNGTIGPGGVLPVSGDLSNLPVSAFCDLIALIPADENCACSDRVFPLDGNQIITQGIGLCDLQAVQVGTNAVAGNLYTWLTPDGLSCTNCSNATYTPGPNVMAGDLVTLVLQEQSGDCSIERRYEIQFGGSFGIETQDQSSCAGDPVTLEATAGGSAYSWMGPGITNANQQTLVVQPGASSEYSVTVTFAQGCTGTGSVSVFVIPASELQLPTLTTCEGQPVSILGQTTDVPGIYTLELQNVNGCDSIITQELIVEPSLTEETQLFCEGSSKTVLDSVFTSSGRICKTEISSTTGCLLTTCVTVTAVPNPQLPEQDSAYVIPAGGGVVIETPDNFTTYEWTPFDPEVLNCGDCPDPVASPDTSTTFILVVSDGNGCRDTAQYRIFVCDEGKILIPNAFTPNGDGANDVFQVVPYEGAEVILSLRIFNRWGQKLYEGSGPNAQWDGRIGDQPAASDVYVWVLEYECGGQRYRRSMDVTLLR